MQITLQEPLRAVFYAPFYAALSRDAYAEEGVNIRFVSSPRPEDAAAGFFDGTVDVGWGGPMRVMETYQLRPDCDLVCFAEVVTRDPFFVLGRAPRSGFTLADLIGPKIGTVSEVPTPWLCLQQDLREAGLDPEKLDRVSDRNMADNLAALCAGEVDAMQCFEPVVEQALGAAAGHLWYEAASRGRTTYTAFVTTRDRLDREAEALLRMVRAIRRTQQWIAVQPAAEIAAAIGAYFPALDPGVLGRALARYQRQQVWGGDPVLPEDGFSRLRRSLVSGGFVRHPPDFAVCVDNRLARAACAE